MGLTWEEIQEGKKKVEEYERSLHPLPKCPVCGSENVRRISSAEKVGNAMAFGFFGNKRKQQFECMNPNCKYRF